MTVKNLTRDEARARAALLDVASYDVTLDLTGDEDFGSTSVVRFTCREPGATTFVELDGVLVAAELNGRPLNGLEGNRLALTDLAGQNVLTVTARGAYSRTGEGLHRFTDPADGLVYLWAQSFLDDAQRMFACFDQPDLKATFRLTVDAPAPWTVIANARGTRTGNRWTFAPTERISTYLFTVAAGPWHSEHRWYGTPGEQGGIELGLHCRRSLGAHLDADELFEVTAQCLDLQQQLFARRYPFGDTYDQLFVPEFNHGAMENPGAVTFTEDFVFRSRVTDDQRRKRAMVIAHEMAHMWFGDLVTMRWWDDLWLNESFAELLGFFTVDRATRHEDTWVDFSATRKAWGYRADQLPSTHPVQGDVADNRGALLNFDGISYAKGASVLRQLMATVGEPAFFAGVQAYLARHAFGNTGFVIQFNQPLPDCRRFLRRFEHHGISGKQGRDNMAIRQMRGEIIRAKHCQHTMRFVPHRVARSGLAVEQALRCAVGIGFDRDIDFVRNRFHLGARFPHRFAGFARD